MTKPRGFGYIEIVIVLAVVAVAGYLLMQYFTTTAKTVEKLQQDRPLARTRLAADQATLTSMQGLVRNYQAEKGQFPPDKAAVVSLLAGPPRFQCPGNDFEYDPATGALRLAITDDSRC
jgi:type II secretory pathway pseudopilin PulG